MRMFEGALSDENRERGGAGSGREWMRMWDAVVPYDV